MLKATDDERQDVLDYLSSQGEVGSVEIAQKVYSERVHSVPHDVWDVRTKRHRWWVITNPTNLYSQEQFPDLDLALTFHIGLCIRVPKAERPTIDGLDVEPLTAPWRAFDDAATALERIEEIEDCQAVGVRCREALLTLIKSVQDLLVDMEIESKPKGSDFPAWIDLVADEILAGSGNKDRRALLKRSSHDAWGFVNWLTHAKGAEVGDAHAAVKAVEMSLSLCTAALIRHVRGVPPRCPRCGSIKLYPQRAVDPDDSERLIERPACRRCDWTGTATLVFPSAAPEEAPPTGECIEMTKPLMKKPAR